MKDHKPYEIYCPICKRTITAINLDEVTTGEDSGYVFVHDDIQHNDTDLHALDGGIN